jgi:hypothetical protein
MSKHVAIVFQRIENMFSICRLLFISSILSRIIQVPLYYLILLLNKSIVTHSVDFE